MLPLFKFFPFLANYTYVYGARKPIFATKEIVNFTRQKIFDATQKTIDSTQQKVLIRVFQNAKGFRLYQAHLNDTVAFNMLHIGITLEICVLCLFTTPESTCTKRKTQKQERFKN